MDSRLVAARLEVGRCDKPPAHSYRGSENSYTKPGDTTPYCLPPRTHAADYAWPVVRVIDGDTVAVDVSGDLPPGLADLTVRLRGVDTPEKGWRAKCDAEREAGQAATAFMEAALAGAGEVVIRDPAWGKWGGPVIADLIVNSRSLAAALIAFGHGRAYNGGKRGGWCE